MKNLFVRFVREEEGQDLIEYSLLAALIAVACIAAMTTLATEINGIFAYIGTRAAGSGFLTLHEVIGGATPEQQLGVASASS